MKVSLIGIMYVHNPEVRTLLKLNSNGGFKDFRVISICFQNVVKPRDSKRHPVYLNE